MLAKNNALFDLYTTLKYNLYIHLIKYIPKQHKLDQLLYQKIKMLTYQLTL